jgi:light-regulated signal transduction histidine kinase (bacteriophytochrome)
MEVGASLTISLIQKQELWGLIACHHNSPKFIPYEVRTICEFLGQLMSTELANKEANENLDYKLQLKNIQGQFVERLSKANDFVQELIADPEALLKLTGAMGAALCAASYSLDHDLSKNCPITPTSCSSSMGLLRY